MNTEVIIEKQRDEDAIARPRPVRRIVTGENALGKSVFVSDGPAPNHTYVTVRTQLDPLFALELAGHLRRRVGP